MGVVFAILLVLLLLAVMIGILWLLALRANPAKNDFYGMAGYHYAHRGLHDASRGIPENSLRAFRLAAENGYGAELDVHLSRDKRLVVMHDESLLRTAGLDQNICAVTAKTLDLLTLEGTNEKVPYLEEVLPLFNDRGPLVIEIKPHGSNYARLTNRVCKLLDSFPNVVFCIESFDPRVLIWLKKNRPEILRGQLSMNFVKERNGLKLPLAFALKNLLLNFFAQPDFVAYRFEDRRALSLRLCRKLWKVQEFSWTIRSPEDAQAALEDHSAIIFEGFAP